MFVSRILALIQIQAAQDILVSDPTETFLYRSGNNETCEIDNPAEDRWYISIKGYRAYSGVDLFAEWE